MKYIIKISIIVSMCTMGYFLGYNNREWVEIKRMTECAVFKDEVTK